MNDLYAEWLVRRKTPFYAIPVKVAMMFFSLISIILALRTILGVILMFAVCFLTYLTFRNFNLEFEYLFVTDELTVDKIFGKSKRKKAWNVQASEIEIVAPKNSEQLKEYEKMGMSLLDFSSHINGRELYVMIANQNGKSVKVIFEPNDKILACLKQAAPRKVSIEKSI